MQIEVTKDFFGYSATELEEDKLLLSFEIREVTIPDGKYSEKIIPELYALRRYGADDLEHTAAIYLLSAIFEDYDQLVFVPHSLHADEKLILSNLFKEGRISKRQLEDAALENYEYDFSIKGIRSNIVAINTQQNIAGNTRGGYVPTGARTTYRYSRQYTQDRVAQILRHLSTQFYNYLQSTKQDPKEVQIMYVNGSLVIATNIDKCTKALYSGIETAPKLNAILTRTYKRAKNAETDTSKRFANKIRRRLYQDQQFLDSRVTHIKALFDVNNFNKAEINMPYVKEHGLHFVARRIYFVNVSSDFGRHAEENLLDLLQKYIEVNPAYGQPVIWGKKRPCFTCHSRLQAASNNGVDFAYNPYRGLFYKHAYLQQNNEGALASTDQLHFSGSVYESKPGGSGYCTLSDSDDPDVEELSTEALQRLVI